MDKVVPGWEPLMIGEHSNRSAFFFLMGRIKAMEQRRETEEVNL